MAKTDPRTATILATTPIGTPPFVAGIAATLAIGAARLTLLGALAAGAVFIAGFNMPLSVDHGPEVAMPMAIAIDTALLMLVALVQIANVTGRTAAFAARRMPVAIANAIPNVATAITLASLMVLWRPIPAIAWQVTGPFGDLLWATMGIGIAIAATAPAIVSGLSGNTEPRRQTRKQEAAQADLSLIIAVSGGIVALWAVPTMTIGHLILSAALSLIAITMLMIRRSTSRKTNTAGPPKGARPGSFQIQGAFSPA